jgi:sugar (pentulose or hexulose) kinase
MVLSTRASIGDVYIVVLDVTSDAVRALLFDCEARRVEGYSALLPRRADAAADCLDEMHRLAHEAGFRIAAVVGRAESEVTTEDRKLWPAFEGAKWFPALPEGAGAILGSGCVRRELFGLAIGEASLMGTVVDRQLIADGLTCAPIDEKRWLLSGAVPDAGGAYAALKHEFKARGSIEGYLETAAAGDPHLAGLHAVARKFREIYLRLFETVGKPDEVIASGAVLLKSPAWTQRIAEALGVTLTLCTEPEPAGRGSALWALERIGTEAETPAAS